MGIPPLKVRSSCAVGVDVRPGSYDIAIGESSRVNPEQSVAKLVFYGKVRDEKDVLWLCDQYPVRCGVADGRPDTTIIFRMVEKLRKARKDFWRAQYNPNPINNVEMTMNEAEHIVTLHRTMALDNVFFAAHTAMGLALPENFMEICAGQFSKEMCSSTRVPVIFKGQEAWEWTGGADHAMHAVGYMMAAMRIGKMSMATSDFITITRGAVQGSIQASSDDEESDFVNPFSSPGEPSEMEGRIIWGDDAGV